MKSHHAGPAQHTGCWLRARLPARVWRRRASRQGKHSGTFVTRSLPLGVALRRARAHQEAQRSQAEQAAAVGAAGARAPVRAAARAAQLKPGRVGAKEGWPCAAAAAGLHGGLHAGGGAVVAAIAGLARVGQPPERAGVELRACTTGPPSQAGFASLGTHALSGRRAQAQGATTRRCMGHPWRISTGHPNMLSGGRSARRAHKQAAPSSRTASMAAGAPLHGSSARTLQASVRGCPGAARARGRRAPRARACSAARQSRARARARARPRSRTTAAPAGG